MTLGVQLPSRAIGARLDRIDGQLKVTGAARYAYEYPVAGVTYVFPIQSTIAKGRVVSTDARAARALPGVVAVLSHENAPRLRPVDIPVIGQRDQDLAVFQSDVVTYRGQVVAAVGGGFGSKAFAHSHVILAVMAARVAGRPAKLALTRQQMFALTGYRSPTIQRIRLGAERDGRLIAIAHDVVAQTTTRFEFAEQAAVPTRMMYAAPNRRTTHRLARLDVPENTWMRGPGECPGMFALESAMDELAVACGLDPIDLRIRNEPSVDPETGHPFSSRGLVPCLREGVERFGWQPRDPRPGM